MSEILSSEYLCRRFSVRVLAMVVVGYPPRRQELSDFIAKFDQFQICLSCDL